MATSEIQIEKVGAFGQGVGRNAAGQVFFVAGGLPGDRVEIEYRSETERYQDAKLLSILEKGKERVESPCPYFGECGGCEWLDWSYESQLNAKSQAIQHALSRAGIPVETFLPIQSAPKTLGYRNRIQVRGENGRLGFYKRRSHEIVDIERCAVADEKLNDKLSALREELKGAFRTKIELSLTEDGTVEQTENRPHAFSGFTQVNPEQNTYLRNEVARWVSEISPENVLELYCGNGNLTFHFAKYAKRVLGIDFQRSAIDSARARAREENLSHLSFEPGSVGYSMPKRFQAAGPFDCLILDPPRSGVGKAFSHWVPGSVQNIIYVSCSPLSFAQDAREIAKDFVLKRVQPIDMFPHTHHVELVALFARKEGSQVNYEDAPTDLASRLH